MSYIQQSLGFDERIIQEAKISKVALMPSVITGLLIVYFANKAGDNTIRNFAILIAALIVIGNYIEKNNIELVVTNKRVAGKIGQKKHMDIPLDKVNTVSVSNTFFGTILGYGSVTITASSGQFKYDAILKAESFKSTLINAIDIYKDEQMTKQAIRMANVMRGEATN